MRIRFLGLLFLWIGSFSFLEAQDLGKPPLYNYTPREYKASSANYAAVQDARGVMYFGNFRGVLEFDGNSWNLITLPNRSTVRSIARDSLGNIYVGGVGEFGYLSADEVGKQQLVSLFDKIDIPETAQTNPVFTMGTETGAIFHIREYPALFRWNGTQIETLPLDPRLLQEPYTLYYLDGELYYSAASKGILHWENNAFQSLDPSGVMKGKLIVDWVNFDNNHYLVYETKGGFWLLDKQNGLKASRWSNKIKQNIRKDNFSLLLSLSDGNIFIGTIKGGGYIVNKEGQLLRHINEKSGLQDKLIINAFEDRDGSLWFCLSKGISRADISSPLSRWDENDGLEGLIFSVNRHNGSMYASTPLGVFRKSNGRFRSLKQVGTETWSLFEVEVPVATDRTKKMLLARTLKGIMQIEGDRATKIMEGTYATIVEVSKRKKGLMYINDASQRLFRIIYENNRWRKDPLPSVLNGRYESIAEDQDGAIWLIERYGQRRAYRVIMSEEENATQVKEYGPLDGLSPVITIFRLKGRLLFMTEDGPRIFDLEADAFTPVQIKGLPSYGIQSMVEDQQGRVWLTREAKSGKWFELLTPGKSGEYIRDSLSLSQLNDLEVWGKLYPDEDGLLWIGSSEGLYCYDPQKSRVGQQIPAPLIRNVTITNDSVIYMGAKPDMALTDTLIPKLEYSENTISFSYSTPYFNNSLATRYSYRLVGYNDEWSPWSEAHQKDYTLLPPGEYQFQVKAQNATLSESEATHYAFKILPPWYRTIWAFLAYALILGLLVYLTFRLNTQRLHLKNEHLERLVYERTNEIWEQHKEIVKKTVALKRQKEEIATQHNLMEDKNKELEEAMGKLQAAQTKLVESEKMASLGQLTAGIAHEINNPINYIKGNINPLKRDFTDIKRLFLRIQQLKDRNDAEEAIQKVESFAEEIDAPYLFEEMELLLQGIEDGARRTKEIVDGLKIFSRTGQETFKLVDIHQGIDSTFTLLNNKTKDRILIERHYADLPHIECMPGKLNQVFMNIISNGIQAIEAKVKNGEQKDYGGGTVGKITIRTEASENCLPGKRDCLKIVISDTGTGIPEKIRNKIFDPFFTTKDVGEGTGLGLSITFGIIEKHNGRILVESGEGEGTTFIIHVPFRQIGEMETPLGKLSEERSEN